jgi:hypothetical protein
MLKTLSISIKQNPLCSASEKITCVSGNSMIYYHVHKIHLNIILLPMLVYIKWIEHKVQYKNGHANIFKHPEFINQNYVYDF